MAVTNAQIEMQLKELRELVEQKLVLSSSPADSDAVLAKLDEVSLAALSAADRAERTYGIVVSKFEQIDYDIKLLEKLLEPKTKMTLRKRFDQLVVKVMG